MGKVTNGQNKRHIQVTWQFFNFMSCEFMLYEKNCWIKKQSSGYKLCIGAQYIEVKVLSPEI